MSKEPTKKGSKGLKHVRLLKDEHIIALFDISPSCLYRWRTNKIIPYFKMGNTNFYLEDIILKMMYLRGGKIPEDFDDAKKGKKTL